MGTCSSFYPETEEVMGWAISEKGFHIVLLPEVPDVILKYLGRDVDAFSAPTTSAGPISGAGWYTPVAPKSFRPRRPR